ncbi:MAG: sensor histidine kinase [Sphingobacteriales bacterium]|nr:sensor histidine kinase [Sphingobacteriales bacterium]
MQSFNFIFNCLFQGIMIYHILFFLIQYYAFKRMEFLYYTLFLLSLNIFYCTFILPKVADIPLSETTKQWFVYIEKPLQFLANVFYAFFIMHYLNVKKGNSNLYKLLIVNIFINSTAVFLCILFTILNFNYQAVYDYTVLILFPIVIVTIYKFLVTDTNYSKVVLFGTTFMVLGSLVTFLLTLLEKKMHLGFYFNLFIPVQIGLIIHLFIQSYGLTLKAVELDKMLVISLRQNQKLIEDERSRVAKDLHDGLGGLLSGVKLSLNSITGNVVVSEQHATVFKRVLNQLDNAISEMRRVAHSMMPESLLRFGLAQAIEDFCYDINESKTVQLNFYHHGLEQRLDSSIEITLYRVIQELVNNAIKHAAATEIMIHLVRNENQLTLTVEDNGVGFNINNIQKIKGVGLSNIQSRIDFLKGYVEIDSKKNVGSSFYITIPV